MQLLSVAPTWLWISFIAGIVLILLLDVIILNRSPHKIEFKEALMGSAGWILLALVFNAWFAYQYGLQAGTEFLTGYIVEKSLSVDNLFIMLLIFESFKIPSAFQHRILFYGILGAILMRGILIIVGAQLIAQFHWILYFFGAFLVVTGVKLLFSKDEEKDILHSRSVRILTKVLPLSHKIEGQHFLTREEGKLKVTPLFLALTIVELSDLVFAMDSIPAVFAVTQDPFIAFASNIMAVLGLRALYFVIAGSLVQLQYLRPGLSFILAFIGCKMLLADYIHVPNWLSLGIILTILTIATVCSKLASRSSPTS